MTSRGRGILQRKSFVLKYVVFECIVCKCIVTKPMFITCCSRAVGCQDCVQRWFQERGCCPHCSTVDAVWIELKCVEDLSYTCQLCGDDEVGVYRQRQ